MKNCNHLSIKRLCSMALILMLLSLNAFAQSSVAIIAHKDVVDRVLEKKEVSAIFFGKKNKWQDKSKINFFILKSGDVHNNFLDDYIGKSSSQFKSFWKKQVFTGKGKPPKSFKTEQEMIDHIARTEGAVGYVSKEFLRANPGLVKEIEV